MGLEIVQQAVLNDHQKEQIFRLWNDEYPAKLAYPAVTDFEIYLKNLTQQSHYLLLDEDNKIMAWASTFIRDAEKWFAIIISEKFHGKGIGTKLLNKLKDDERTLNGWVIDHHSDKKKDGKFYRSPLGFYTKNGFEIVSDTRLELDRISAVKITWETMSKLSAR